MAHVLADRVKETSTTTGTGTLTLAGAVANFRTFTSVLANSDTTLYAIIHQSANEWEVGKGTFTTSGTTLARTTVIASSNAGAAVNLSAGTKHVAITLTTAGDWTGLKFDLAATIDWQSGAVVLSAPSNNMLRLSGADLDLLQDLDVTGNLGGAGGTAALEIGTAVDFNQKWIFNLAGDATVPAIEVDAQTIQTTPIAGGIERDTTNFYGTTDTGNRGIIPLRHLIRTNAVRTYISNTSAQTVFNVPANGRITLEAGTYIFGGTFSWGSMSATSGNRNLNILGAGTAAVTNWMWHAWGIDAATGTATAAGASHMVTSTSPVSIVTAAVGTSLVVSFQGSVEVNTGGTLIPTTTMVTAAASTLTIGSFMYFERIGTDAAVSIGQWD